MEPFHSVVRHAIAILKENPRVSDQQVMDKLQENGVIGYDGARDILKKIREDGYLQHRITLTPYRTNPRDKGRTDATTFIDVTLVDDNDEGCRLFENEIKDVLGVIEWDLVRGHTADYLVRAVNLGSDVSIKTAIKGLSSVSDATLSDIYILKSGVVDNFKADNFLDILPDPPRRRRRAPNNQEADDTTS